MTSAKIFGASRHRLTTDGEGVTTLEAFSVSISSFDFAFILYRKKPYLCSGEAGQVVSCPEILRQTTIKRLNDQQLNNTI